jgi:hypothetical protein
MKTMFRSVFAAMLLALAAGSGLAADKPANHRIVIQVSQSDPGRMNLALHNASNAIKYYTGKGEGIEV